MAALGSVKYIETECDTPCYSEPSFTGSPERNLLMAILERAILDYVGNDHKEQIDAAEWIFGGNNPNEHFSFAWLCQELDLNQKKVTDIIKAMPKRGSRKIAPWYYREEWSQ